MFGLDARIALAIFGALSVISGAALYSAIQDAKATSFLVGMQEVAKSIEQFMLDTGRDLRMPSSDPSRFDMEELIEEPSSTPGWNGPYLANSDDSVDGNLFIDGGSLDGNPLGARYLSNDDFPTTSSSVSCSSSNVCYLWILQHSIPESIAKAVDLKVDGTDSPLTGNFRYHLTGSTRHAYLKVAPTLKQF